jgi:hypothetical protein
MRTKPSARESECGKILGEGSFEDLVAQMEALPPGIGHEPSTRARNRSRVIRASITPTFK